MSDLDQRKLSAGTRYLEGLVATGNKASIAEAGYALVNTLKW